MNISELEIAWFAGLFEGEGTFARNLTKGRAYPFIKIGMTDKDTIDTVQRIFGGTVHTIPSQGKNRKPFIYQWRLAKWQDVRYVMMRVFPYLHERRQQRWADMLEYKMQAKEERNETHIELGEFSIV